MEINIAAFTLVLLLISVAPSSAAKETLLLSPDGSIQFKLFVEKDRLSWNVMMDNKPMIENSPIVMLVDKVDITYVVKQGKVENYKVNEIFPLLGPHAQGLNQCNGMRIGFTNKKSSMKYIFEVRAYNSGIAFRLIVPGDAKARTADEASSFIIPAGCTLWYHNLENHYQGIYMQKQVDQLPPGEWAAPPVTVKLPDSRGYICLTEAAVFNYGGMALKTDGQRGLSVRLANYEPVSASFKQQYTDEDARRLAVLASVNGTITTPWRVVILSRDLNGLVNTDIIPSLCPRPDTTLFPQGLWTSWIKPGRAGWKGLDGVGDNSPKSLKEFIKQAGKLGLEYVLLDSWWNKWKEKDLKDVLKLASQQKVGIWLWKSTKELRSEQQRADFMKKYAALGVVGVRVDDFDNEAKETIDLYQAILKDAALNRLMIDFNGCNKPGGEYRTWPNELGHGSVTGMDYTRLADRATQDVILPFTRLVAGYADYTPLLFNDKRGNTTWAHQLAAAVCFSSPLLVFAAHPANILKNPAAEIIRSIPVSWDETEVLEDSEIGDLAVIAKRSGNTWFLAVLTGTNPHTFKIPLTFLGQGDYKAVLLGDEKGKSNELKIQNTTLRRSHIVEVEMPAGGGFLARLELK